MFGISGTELVLILLFGFLLFGPDKLPAMAKGIGSAIKKFKTAQNEMNDVLKNEVFDPNSDEPFKDPLAALDKIGASAQKAEPTESFSQRKARYDRERAAQKAAEKSEAAASAAAAAAGGASVAGAVPVTPVASPSASAAEIFGAAPASQTAPATKAAAEAASQSEKEE